MAKKANNAVTVDTLDHAVTSMIPNDSAMSSAEVERKVSKADLVNIMAVGIIKSLEQTRDKIQFDLAEAHNKVSKAVSDVRDAVLPLLAGEVNKDLGIRHIGIDQAYDATDNVHLIQIRDARSSYGREQNYTQSSKVLKTDSTKFTLELLTYIEFKPFTIKSKEFDTYKKEYNALEEDLKEIKERIAKAQDRSFLKAQLDMALLAGTNKGKETANNLKNLIDSLVNTAFAKKPTPPELTG